MAASRLWLNFVLICCLLVGALPAQVPCGPQWTGGALAAPGLNGPVHAIGGFTLGASTLLYAGGAFSTAGGVSAANIARWNGTAWSALSTGTNGAVTAFALHNDGSGNALYVVGAFTTAGGTPANGIARWNGTAWSAVGAGVSGGFFGTIVNDIAVFDDGTGPKLFVGGNFTLAGGSPASFVARWNGSVWSAVGGGITGDLVASVKALAVHDDGTGSKLYAGGRFSMAGVAAASNLARFNGTSWSAVGTGANGAVLGLKSHADSTGNALYAGGGFSIVDGQAAVGVARWNGTAWSGLGSGLGGGIFAPQAESFASFYSADGTPRLIVGGTFGLAGGVPVGGIAAWDGTSWSDLSFGVTGSVHALCVHNDLSGVGAALYAGGEFSSSGTVALGNVGRYIQPGPVILAQPLPVSICQNGSVALSVTVAGATPLTFQWRKAGVPVSGATASTLSFPGATPAINGVYDCVVTNGCGSVTTTAVPVSVDTPLTVTTPPATQTVCLGAPATFTVVVAGSVNPTFQWRKDGSPINGATSSSYVIPNAAMSDGGSYTVTVGGACGSILSAPGVLTVDPGPTITTQPTSYRGCAGGTATFDLVAAGTVPLTYTWKRQSPGGGITIVQQGLTTLLTITNLNAGSIGTYFCEVTQVNGCGGAVASDPVLLDVESAPTITVPPQSQTVCINSPATFSVQVLAAPPVLYQWFRNGVAINGATNPTYTVPSVTGATTGAYVVSVTNGCATATTSSPAAILSVQPGPQITQPPVGSSICAGTPVTLSITANPNGAPSITYQWRRNGTPIAGATSSTYSIPNPTPAQGGAYSCAVSNGCATVVSANGVLTVAGGVPTITAQPQNITVIVGAPATFSVTATGGALNYQWRHYGGAIVGATGPTFTDPVALPAEVGLYDVVITNACGSVVSQAANLVVSTPLLALSQPGGVGSATVDLSAGPTLALYFTTFTADPANATNPNQGIWFGLWTTPIDLEAQFGIGTPPFVGNLDVAGRALFAVPGGTLPPGLTGLTLYALSVTYTPITDLITPSNVAAITLL